MKTNKKCPLIEKYFLGQISKNENKEAKKQASSDPSPAKNSEFQKGLLDAANDPDFREIFPKIQAAEKNYLKNRTRKSTTPLNLAKLLIAAILLVLLILFVWQLLLSE